MLNKNKIALMLGLFLIIQNAYGLNFEMSAGTGKSCVNTASNSLLGTEDALNEITFIGFGSGVSLAKIINSQFKTGSGQLNESHSATNAEGDYVNVSAHLDNSDSWAYSYDLTTRPSYVSGRENIKVAKGTGLDFRGVARTSSGNRAEVSAVGGANCPVSMIYSNSVKASSSSATAAQQIAGASSAGRTEGCTDPLIISGSAYPVGIIMDENGQQVEIPLAGAPFSRVEAGVLGGSRINAATSASASSSAYSTAQLLSASKFDEIWNQGSSGQVVSGVIKATVGAGASNGTRFVSSVETSFKSGKATASQIASGSGSSIYKFSDASGGLYSSASTNTTVLNGSLITSDKATGKWNRSDVSEILAASGNINRVISAYGKFTPGWNSEETGIGVDNGYLIGSAKASSTPTSFMINGKWLGVASHGTYGNQFVTLQNDTNAISAIYLWNNTRILND
jgi:hypothetical protein